MDPMVLKALVSMVKAVAAPLISLAGVWLGWFLGTRSQWKQRRLDNLQNRLAALREVMSVAENVPPELNITDLKGKFAADPEFCTSLHHRFIRLFGLRTELTPYLEPELRRFIDSTFRPMFVIGAGRYDLIPEKIDRLAYAAIELRRLVTTVRLRINK